MSNKYTWEENNKSYVEIKATLEVKGDEKCYFPCNDCRGLKMRRILRIIDEKHYKDKGDTEEGYEYHPLVRCYSLHTVLAILLIMHSQNVLSF